MHRVAEISLLKAEVEALAAERDEARQQLTEAKRDILNQRLDQANEKIIELSSRNDALREQLAECRGTLERSRTACRETNEARENLLAGNRELSKQLTECQAAAHDRELTVLSLARDNTIVTGQLAECQARVEEETRKKLLAQDSNRANYAARERAEAAAGVLRGLVSSARDYMSMSHEWSTDRVDVWLEMATAALASDAGVKAAAVIAAATEFWRDRTQRIGPLDPSVVDRLLAAVAAMEGIGDG